VTQDGRYIALVRFGSERAAKVDTVRPEQDKWWADTSGLFDGAVTVCAGTAAYSHMTGDPDRTGFVQVIKGRTSDRVRFRELLRAEEPYWSCRPDLLGETFVEHGHSAWTMALYCTTEARSAPGSGRRCPPSGKRCSPSNSS
jgi:hypothetical protein